MDAGTPLTRITLGAASVADDLGYVALTDLARALGSVTEDYRVIGGHMVTVLAAGWQLGRELYRETGDVDLGVPPIVARDHNLVARLKDLNYLQIAGNRFARGLSDIPAGMKGGGGSGDPEALIDEVSALVLKGLATRVRSKDTDIADIWRCLEIAFAAGIGPAGFASGVRAESAELIRALFNSHPDVSVTALISGQRLSAEAADARLTRIRALVARVLGPE